MLSSLFSITAFIISFSQDEVSSFVYKGSKYVYQITDLKDGSRGARDTVKSDFNFIVNTRDSFLFFKKVVGLSPNKTPYKELNIKDMTSESTK